MSFMAKCRAWLACMQGVAGVHVGRGGGIGRDEASYRPRDERQRPIDDRVEHTPHRSLGRRGGGRGDALSPRRPILTRVVLWDRSPYAQPCETACDGQRPGSPQRASDPHSRRRARAEGSGVRLISSEPAPLRDPGRGHRQVPSPRSPGISRGSSSPDAGRNTLRC